MVSVRSLAPVGKFVLRGNGQAVKVATAIAQDAEISGRLNRDTVIKLSNQIAKAYDSKGGVAVRHNKLNILNIERNSAKAHDYLNLCKSTDERASEILSDKYFDKDKLINVFKSASCFDCMDKDVFVGLAKSIVAK